MSKKLFADLKYFNWFIKNLSRWKDNKYSLILLAYWILYLIFRLFFGMTGKEKVRNIFRNIIKNKDTIISFPIDSKKYYINLRDLCDFDVFHEVCIRDHYNYSLLKPGMIVVDIGAHIGTFTLLASEKVGEGRVIAIEPEIHNFKQLKRNLVLNKIKNVISVNMALNEYCGKASLFINKDSMGHSLLSNRPNIIFRKRGIEVKTLDDLLKEINIRKVDFLKINAEGVELAIIKGAQETFKINPTIKMIIEAFHYPHEEVEVIDYLKKLNFSPEISKDLIGCVCVGIK